MSIDNNKFGRALAAARDAAGLTQAELGDKLGVRQQSVAKWEVGITFPGPQNLRKLSGLLGHFWGDTSPRAAARLAWVEGRNRRAHGLERAGEQTSQAVAHDLLVEREQNPDLPDVRLPLRFAADVGQEIVALLPPDMADNLNSMEARAMGVDYLSDKYAIEIKTISKGGIEHSMMRIKAALWHLQNAYRRYPSNRSHCLLLITNEHLDESPTWQRLLGDLKFDAQVNNVPIYTASNALSAANVLRRLEKGDHDFDTNIFEDDEGNVSD